MKRFVSWIFALTYWTIFTNIAQAQIIYEFADSTGTATTNFSINGTGGTVLVEVYLHDKSTGATILNSNGGLASSAVRLTYNNPSGIAAINSLSSDVSGAIPPWNTFTTNGSSISTSAVINLIGSFSSGVLPDANGRIFLGTFTLHGLTPGTVNLTATDPNPGSNFDTTFFTNGAGIDSTISDGNSVLTFTATPEPGEIVTLSIIIMLTICFIIRLKYM